MHPDVLAAVATLPRKRTPAEQAQQAEEMRQFVEKFDREPLPTGAPIEQKARRLYKGGTPVPAPISFEVRKLRTQKLAREFVASEDARGLELPAPITLTELQRAPIPESKFAVDRLWPDGGNVLLAAQRKAGKTTIVGNLLRALVDGTRPDPCSKRSTPSNARLALLRACSFSTMGITRNALQATRIFSVGQTRSGTSPATMPTIRDPSGSSTPMAGMSMLTVG